MSELDDTRAANGGRSETAGAEVAASMSQAADPSAPFFTASPDASADTATRTATTIEPPASARAGGPAAVVKGRIKIEDEVAEKVAALAALEVDGVADLGGDVERVIETVRSRIGVGQRRGDQGVRAKVTDREVAIDVVIVVEYGRIALEVATAVKANVARAANHMLGMRVTEVNVTVDDVRLPGEQAPALADKGADAEPAPDEY